MAVIKAFFWNTQERRLRAFWRLLIFSLLLLLITLITSIILGLLLQLFNGTVADFAGAFAMQTVLALAVTILSMWLAARFLDRRPFADFGFHLSRSWFVDLGFGLLLGALLMTGIFLIEWAAGWLTVRDTFYTDDPSQPFATAIFVPLLLFLGVGIYEEMLLRGYVLHNLAEGLNIGRIGPRLAIVLAWLLSSLIFGLLHASNPHATFISTSNIALAGIFLGLAYVLTGELALPIGLHISWNFFQGNVFGFPVSGGSFQTATFIAIRQGGPDLWTGGAFGPEAGLLGVAAMLVGSALILLWVRFRHHKLTLYGPLAQPPAWTTRSAETQPLEQQLW